MTKCSGSNRSERQTLRPAQGAVCSQPAASPQKAHPQMPECCRWPEIVWHPSMGKDIAEVTLSKNEEKQNGK